MKSRWYVRILIPFVPCVSWNADGYGYGGGNYDGGYAGGRGGVRGKGTHYSVPWYILYYPSFLVFCSLSLSVFYI